MNTTDRLSLSLAARDLSAFVDQFQESLIDPDGSGLALVADADRVHTAAAELFARVVGMVRQPGELQFVGANVLVEERAPEHDKSSQRIMAARHEARATELEAARDAAGITSVLDDTAGAANSDRDHRGAA